MAKLNLAYIEVFSVLLTVYHTGIGIDFAVFATRDIAGRNRERADIHGPYRVTHHACRPLLTN